MSNFLSSIQHCNIVSGIPSTQNISFDQSSLDSFGNLKVAEPFTTLEYNHILGEDLSLESSNIVGSGFEDHTTPYSELTVVTTNDKVEVQTRTRAVYQAGKSLLVLCTFNLNYDANSNCVSTVGYYDQDDGIFLSYDSNTNKASIVWRNSVSGSVVDTTYLQDNWNIDSFDGTGKSKFTIDWTKTQLMAIELAWLGVAKFEVFFYVDGKLMPAHRVIFTNSLALPYMRTASLPIRYSLESFSGGGAMIHNCSSVLSYGGSNILGRVFTTNNNITLKTIATIAYPLIALRLKTTGIFLKVNVYVYNINIESSSTNPLVLGEVYIFHDKVNANFLTGNSFVSVDDESACERDISSTAIDLTGGRLIYSGYITKNSSNINIRSLVEKDIILTSNINGLTSYLVVCARAFSGTEDCVASIGWKEVI